MRIGVVDLDTSHPQNWIPILRELGHDVVGVWDGGAIHPPEYVTKFVEDRSIPHLYPTLEAMVSEVDCAIIHGCNWDTHVEKARPFVKAGKSVLIDKPVAGNMRDLKQLLAWSEAGTRIAGGSSLRFCVEATEWLAQPEEERGTPHTALCGCGTDEFNYGIHAYSLLSSLMGPGIRSVRHLGAGTQRRIQVAWNDERRAMLTIGGAVGYQPFYITLVTAKGVSHLKPDAGKLYRALLEATLPYLAGETDAPPVPFNMLIEPELCALAARQSWLDGDREVSLSELRESDTGYDGAEFAAGYRKMRYP
jgi:hypothetical protein